VRGGGVAHVEAATAAAEALTVTVPTEEAAAAVVEGEAVTVAEESAVYSSVVHVECVGEAARDGTAGGATAGGGGDCSGGQMARASYVSNVGWPPVCCGMSVHGVL
jgi:hypothetical protein